VTELIAVAALDIGKVARLGAVPSHMALLTAVAATTAATALRAITREVTNWKGSANMID
jgi:hypothetical protein